MGYQDNFPAIDRSILSAMGESVIYTPADSRIPPFTVNVLFDVLTIDDLDAHVVSDSATCSLSLSDLETAGVVSPTSKMERIAGDTITRSDSTIWTLTGSPQNDGGLISVKAEKNIRIAP